MLLWPVCASASASVDVGVGVGSTSNGSVSVLRRGRCRRPVAVAVRRLLLSMSRVLAYSCRTRGTVAQVVQILGPCRAKDCIRRIDQAQQGKVLLLLL